MNPGGRTGRAEGAQPALTEAYEGLRRQVVDHEVNRGWGLALFVHRGMAAWASAWVRCTQSLERSHPVEWERGEVSRARLPRDTETLVGVLCAMVWALEREAAA